MDATHNSEEPSLCPYSFAKVVLRTERLIIKVLWDWGIVSKSLAFGGDGFFGSGNDHVDVEVQFVFSNSILSVSLERCGEKIANRCRDPIKKMVLACKQKGMSRVKVEMQEFLGCKVNPRLYVPHMRNMENVKELLTMLRAMRCP
jgi:hypothetical protein